MSKELHEQAFLAHRYQNNLIELALEGRRRYRELRSKYVPEVAERESVVQGLLEQAAKIRAEIKAGNAAERRRKGATSAQKQQLLRLKEATTVAKESLQQARLKAKEHSELTAAVEDMQVEMRARKKEARATCGVYWGTYLLIEAAVDAATKSRTDPRFKRFDGDARVGVQLQRDNSIADVFAGRNTMLQIDPLPADQWDTRTKRDFARTSVRIRIGSNGREGIYAELGVLLHRQIPEDAVVKWAWILIRREGTRRRYELQLVMESDTFVDRTKAPQKQCAVDLGWRVRPTGVRVATMVGSDGACEELVMPEEIRAGLAKAAAVHGYAEKHFNVARAHLADYLKRERAAEEPWVAEATEHLHAWKAPTKLSRFVSRWSREVIEPDRLYGLWRTWRAERLAAPKQDLFDLKEAIFEWGAREGLHSEREQLALYLELWRFKDRHLVDMEASCRRQAKFRRRDLYRHWAKKLASTYQEILVENFDLRVFARNVSAEEGESSQDFTHRIQREAAPGKLREFLVSRAGKARVRPVEASYTTRECHLCGHMNNDWEHPEARVQTCGGCAAEWDQDENACRVMLKRDGLGGNGAGRKPPRKKRTKRSRSADRSQSGPQVSDNAAE